MRKERQQPAGLKTMASACIATLLTLTLCATAAEEYYSGGTGEPNSPFLISTPEDLNDIGIHEDHWDKHFLLSNDVNLAAYDANSFSVIEKFEGVFEGDGHVISNFTHVYAMFRSVWGPNAVVQNLTLLNPVVHAESEQPWQRSYAASLVENLADNGRVSNCCMIGGVVSGDSVVGGLVGTNAGSRKYGPGPGRIENSFSTGSVTGRSVGGLVGRGGGYITNCYSSASVDGESQVGGLAGSFDFARAANCYSTGKVTGDFDTGGLVGALSHWGGGCFSCYWDVETSGQTTSACGDGVYTRYMKRASTFKGWNCDGVWVINEGLDYPRLIWEETAGTPIGGHEFSGGSGEPNDPYLIATPRDFRSIGGSICNLDKCFKMVSDIDLLGYSGNTFDIIGTESFPFQGVFDGNDHTILRFDYTDFDGNYIGIFGYAGEESEIRNVILAGPDVTTPASEEVGILVGRLDGRLHRCSVYDGRVQGYARTGGLVGWNFGVIASCYADCLVLGGADTGGLAGRNNGMITDSFAHSEVAGTGNIGVVAGFTDGSIINCGSDGVAVGDGAVGGLVGGGAGEVRHCYSAASVYGHTHVGGLVGFLQYGSIASSIVG
ncbi:MAG: GLUG motif-containing protein, partial [Planctomycetota bacterium]